MPQQTSQVRSTQRRRRGRRTPLHEVVQSPDGATVWVNAADGSCIGRFSRRHGIDVHTTSAEQLEGGRQCLFCTHEPANQAAWESFCDAMLLHHRISVDRGLVTFP